LRSTVFLYCILAFIHDFYILTSGASSASPSTPSATAQHGKKCQQPHAASFV
jgi:hypothetical protein